MRRRRPCIQTLVTRIQPEYPSDAKKAKIEGVVVLECTIDADGAVRDLKPVRSEPMGLTEAAIKAVCPVALHSPLVTRTGKPSRSPGP